MLVWARETARLSVESAAQRLHVGAAELEAWEHGQAGLTVAKLQNMADLYRRPLAAFFLSERPDVPERVRDFRRPWRAGQYPESPNLAAEIRRAEAQRENVLEILDLRDEAPSGMWRTPAAEHDMESYARVMLDEHALVKRPGPSGKPTDWFFYWSSALEEVGVLVVTATRVPSAEADGFSIAFDPVPVIAVNGGTHFNRRIFTLLHEYAHLLANTSALCDLHEDSRTPRDVDRLEVECNRIAAEILVPSAKFATRPIVTQASKNQENWPLATLREEARVWGVSPEVILRKLVTHQRASKSFYDAWRDARSEDDRYSSGSDARANGGGDGLRTKVRNLGKGYVRSVVGALSEGYLTTYETSNMLNAKVDQIPKMLARARVPEVD
ncbi:XRE family transcriptional regulator [Naasia aerilata]|nr:XRE family transcriptional regulator [Naasia aerilata]